MIPDRLLHTILTDINWKYKNFSDQQLVNTLMGLSDFKENSQVQATASKLFWEIKERGLKNLDPSSPHYPLDIRYIVAIYNLYGRDDIPSDIYNEYQRVIKLTSKISHSEKVCLSHVREKFENAESWVHIDGFELDILIWKKLNIEIDGWHHKDQSHYDKKRDTYLLGKYWIRTERYVLCEATIEKEIISFKKWFRQLLEEIRAEADKN